VSAIHDDPGAHLATIRTLKAENAAQRDLIIRLVEEGAALADKDLTDEIMDIIGEAS
jgi:hypothetical protein